jgi:hypothetical protein
MYNLPNTMAKSKPVGGLKGLIQRTGQFCFASGVYVWRIGCTVGYQIGGKIAFSIATTSMVVFMPLILEISRETLVGWCGCGCIQRKTPQQYSTISWLYGRTISRMHLFTL